MLLSVQNTIVDSDNGLEDCKIIVMIALLISKVIL